jgi:hypothetical protein
MTDCFLGILRDEVLQLRFGLLVFQEGRAGAAEEAREFRPGIRGTHVDDMNGFDLHSRRFRQEQSRRLARFNAAPEFFLGREQQVLVERISRE